MSGPSSGLNCAPDSSTQGCTNPPPGRFAGAKAGGVGTHTPGAPAFGAVYGYCACAAPSDDRIATISSATASPKPNPGSPGLTPNFASDWVSIVPRNWFWEGTSCVSARYAAPSAAAVAEAPAGGASLDP